MAILEFDIEQELDRFVLDLCKLLPRSSTAGGSINEDLEEKTGILDMDLSRTIFPEDFSLLRALFILFSSSTLNDPTGILDGTTGFTSASCSHILV